MICMYVVVGMICLKLFLSIDYSYTGISICLPMTLFF